MAERSAQRAQEKARVAGELHAARGLLEGTSQEGRGGGGGGGGGTRVKWKELALERDAKFREEKKDLEDALRAQRMENERLRAQLGVGAAAVPAAAAVPTVATEPPAATEPEATAEPTAAAEPTATAEPAAAADPAAAVPGRGARVRRAVVRDLR